VDGLAIPGGAPSYDYQLLSNKIAHSAVLGIISLRHFIWVAASGVKELSGFTRVDNPARRGQSRGRFSSG
jgi:hypothetical protein